MAHTTKSRKNLLVWNGMTSQQVSGGDVYVKNFVSQASAPFDIATTKYAKELLGVTPHGVLGGKDGLTASGGVGIAVIYLLRVLLWSPRTLLRSALSRYRHVVSASPFACDLIPAAFARADRRTAILFHLLPERDASGIGTRLRFFVAKLEQKCMLQIINWRFDTVLVGNEELRAELATRFKNKAIYVAHAGIDTKKIDASPNSKKDRNLAVFVGRLTTQKGILDLLAVAKRAHQKNSKFKLVVIGDGPDRSQLEAAVSKAGARYIELLGFTETAKKYKLMKQAQYFVFPSYEEGWGIALAEALYAECLCLCYELPHYKGIFSDYPIYAKLGDKRQLAELLVGNRGTIVSAKQKRFAAQYDSVTVVRVLLKKLELL